MCYENPRKGGCLVLSYPLFGAVSSKLFGALHRIAVNCAVSRVHETCPATLNCFGFLSSEKTAAWHDLESLTDMKA